MVDVDSISSPEWASILEALQLNKIITEFETEDVIGKDMESLEKWETFYKTYAYWMGFSIRIDDVKRKGEIITMRRWVCSREGFRREKFINNPNRKKKTKPVTRTGCQAAFRVVRVANRDIWRCKEFVHSHNHDFASMAELQLLRSNRACSDAMVAQVISINKVGIKTSHIVAHMSLQSGGYSKLPCQLRDVYNKVATMRRRDRLESNSEAALSFLDHLSKNDQNLYAEYQLNDENRLSNLFWADGKARRDYADFGEVLGFDTTYKTNKYNKPLLILLGVNHHFQTCVFGFALLLDETSETFGWLLRVFLDCMNGEKPNVVLTDGDPAMRVGILEFLPEATHRLCAWHLGNNATQKVKKPLFTIGLHDLIYNFYSEEEFESKWHNLLVTLELEDHQWCVQAYEKKKQWAEAFLRGCFVGGMRTTQRCESMNSTLKKFFKATYPLKEFVEEIDIALSKMRHTEVHCDYTSKHTNPELLPQTDVMRPFYQHVSEIYTRDMYYKVVEELSNENAYSVTNHEDHGDYSQYTLNKFRHGEIRYKVEYWPTNNHLKCTCLLFDTDGYPCRHIWAVMKHLDIRVIPLSLLLKRWRKDATTSLSLPVLNIQESNTQRELMEMSRYGSLNSDANLMNFYASKVESSYLVAKEEMARLTAAFKEAYENRSIANVDNQATSTGHRNNPNIIRDPVIVKTKGSRNHGSNELGIHGHTPLASARPRICRVCSGVGHDRRNCPQTNTIPRSQGRASSSNNALEQDQETGTAWTNQNNFLHDYSTQDSLQSSNFMY